jgi:SOS response regulatory protein OraA/RecX
MRTVTALHPEGGDRVRIDLDGEAWRTVPAAAVVSGRLRVGVVLDRERARDLRRAMRRSEALDAAGRALSRRDRSVAELDAQLARRGVRGGERQAAVETMSRLGYVDDARFARSRAETLAVRGYGDAAIVYDLEQRGVGSEQIATALEALAPEADRARAALARMASSEKAVRSLAAKGFSAEAVEAAVGSFD